MSQNVLLNYQQTAVPVKKPNNSSISYIAIMFKPFKEFFVCCSNDDSFMCLSIGPDKRTLYAQNKASDKLMGQLGIYAA